MATKKKAASTPPKAQASVSPRASEAGASVASASKDAASPAEAEVVKRDAEEPEHAAGAEPYGTHVCPECKAQVFYMHPGYLDPAAWDREMACPQGHRFLPKKSTFAHASD